MATRYVNVDRDTPLLLPLDLREWVRQDDQVHFILAAVNRVDLSAFTSNVRGTGDAQYPPGMMLAVLVYCYSHGIFGSRRIERATYEHLSVRYLAGDTHPDHDTICKFRRENFQAMGECFLQVLELARELKLLKVGTVAIDGTRLRANGSKHKNITYQRAGEVRALLQADIAELLAKAEQADLAPEERTALPTELQRREKLEAKLAEAQAKLEARARQEAEAQRPEYEAKVAARAQRPGSSKGPRPKPPRVEPEPTAQINLTDEDSRLMRRSRNEAYEQCYNAQAAVCAEGSQLIVGVAVSQCAADSHELEPTLAAIDPRVGQPKRLLADSGFLDTASFARIEARGIELYAAVAAEASLARRRYEFRPKDRRRENPVDFKDPRLLAMKAKVESAEGRAIYAKRQTSVEPVFGIIKSALGFRQFMLRGCQKVRGEWTLVALAYNCKRLCNLRRPARAKTTSRTTRRA
jgi:transposase